MKTKQVIKRVAEYDQFGYPRWTSVESLSFGASETEDMAKDPEERIRELELENRPNSRE